MHACHRRLSGEMEGWSYTCSTSVYIALCSASDAERLVKEVSSMLSFKHTNVMFLVGVCLNGGIPLLIMPFTSNERVLEFVKHHRD